MNPKKTLVVVATLILAWLWWSMALGGIRGDDEEVLRLESAVRTARAEILVPVMTADEAMGIADEAIAPLSFYGDPEHPDRAEARSRHVRSAILALIDAAAADACAPSVSDAGAVPGPHTSEIIPLTVSVTVPDVEAVRGLLLAFIEHPPILLQSVAVKEAAGEDARAVASDVGTCAGWLVQASFDLYARVSPAPPPEGGADG